MDLPSYEFCKAKINAGTDTELHRFIVYNEPEISNKKLFRDGLERLLNALINDAEEEMSVMQEVIDDITHELHKRQDDND